MNHILSTIVFDQAPVLVSFSVSLLFCFLLVTRSRALLNLQHMHVDISAAQSMHSTPTPRLGGVAVLLGLVVAIALRPRMVPADLWIVIGAGAIVFVFGLKEDLSRNVPSRFRLAAAFGSSAIAMVGTSYTVTGLGLPQTDWLFAVFGVSYVFTLVWAAGTCHAMNLIDGVNGLSAGYAVVAFSCLGIISAQSGIDDFALVIPVLISAIFGFLIFNWPFGRIFMGDAGAYAIGHLLAWFGIVLISKSPDVSPLAVLLILFWPVADTLFSMIRRVILSRAISHPDRLHFHHIVVRLLDRILRNRVPRSWLNPLCTLVLLPFFTAPAIAGVIFWDQHIKALVCLLGFALAFLASYMVIIDLLASRRFGRRRNFD